MKEAFKHASPQEEYFTSEGCFILELSNAPDDPGLSIARACGAGRDHALAQAREYRRTVRDS